MIRTLNVEIPLPFSNTTNGHDRLPTTYVTDFHSFTLTDLLRNFYMPDDAFNEIKNGYRYNNYHWFICTQLADIKSKGLDPKSTEHSLLP